MSALIHLRHQGPVIAGLGRLALASAAQKLGRAAPPLTELPGPEIRAVVPPRNRDMVQDYVRWAGGDVRAWRGRVPPHLFPQWGFPLLGQTLTGITYPLARVLNGGCRIESHAPIPGDAPLHLTARLQGIDDNGRRAVLHQRLETADADGRLLQTAHVYAIVPLGGGDASSSKGEGRSKKTRKVRPLVHPEARLAGRRRLTPEDGRTFACLTGDINPIHWLKPYATAAGFGRTIMHGFGTLAVALETLRRTRWAGDIDWPATVDVRFTRPVKLPSKVNVFTHGDAFFAGPAPGAPAWLTGTFTPLSEEDDDE